MCATIKVAKPYRIRERSMRFFAAYFVVALFVTLLLPIPGVGGNFGQLISVLIIALVWIPFSLLGVRDAQMPWVRAVAVAFGWVLFALALADYIDASRRGGARNIWALNAAILVAGLPTFVWVASLTFEGGPS